MDKYQERYLVHQEKKGSQLTELIKKRHSDRVFTKKEIPLCHIHKILDNTKLVPSSCNRRAVKLRLVQYRDNKALLGGILVGGVGWIHRADKIFLVVADKKAYKEGLFYMPFLDAGFLAYNVWLTCTELGIGCCFVNPNVRLRHKDILLQFIGAQEIFCGALALGYI